MKKDFIYWLRWIAVLPGALIFGFLILFPLHWILYFALAKGETISGVNIRPIEYTFAPFVSAITFILIGFEIAPKYKFQTSIILTILHMSFVIYLIIFMSAPLEIRGILGLLGSFLGLYITWIKSRLTPPITPPNNEVVIKINGDNKMKEKIEKIYLKEFGYMGVVDTQISIYDKLRKEMPELSENEILNKLIFSRIQALPNISQEEEEYLYYLQLLQNPLKDLRLVIIHIVNYEFIESRKEEIKKIIPFDYVIKFQMESAKYIQEKIIEYEEYINRIRLKKEHEEYLKEAEENGKL